MIAEHLSVNDAGVDLWLETVGDVGSQSAVKWRRTKHIGVFIAAVKTHSAIKQHGGKHTGVFIAAVIKHSAVK